MKIKVRNSTQFNAIRTLYGGRYNFTSRSVIAPNPSLRIDEVTLSYQCLCGLMEQRIINILHKSFSMRYNDAYKFLHENMAQRNDIIMQIIDGIIHSTERGVPIIINRNPTLQLGSLLQVYCVGVSDGYVMEMPLQILTGLAADKHQCPLIEKSISANSVNCWELSYRDNQQLIS